MLREHINNISTAKSNVRAPKTAYRDTYFKSSHLKQDSFTSVVHWASDSPDISTNTRVFQFYTFFGISLGE
jgi:hypothetical protein